MELTVKINMDKILTLSIAAYHVENYLRNTLDHITASSYIDEIEVLVIDDGGKDGSLDIAKEFEAKYPASVHAVHKENGGYGTVVNLALKMAEGKYFKLIDGDDWVDTDGLNRFVEFLHNNEPDAVFTEVKRFDETTQEMIEKRRWREWNNRVLDVGKIDFDIDCGMWYLAYRTEHARRYMRELPAKSLYTDVLFSTYPMPYVKTVGFLSEWVYIYRIGRNEQSVSRASRNKHYLEYHEIINRIKEYYYEVNGNNLPAAIKKRFLEKYRLQILNLLLLPASKEIRNMLVKTEEETKKKYPDFYDYAEKRKKIRLLRYSNYLAYWPIAKWGKNEW